MSLITKIQRLPAAVFVIFFLAFPHANAQCVVNSTAGYQVNVAICPQSIVVSSTNCPNGYNYNVNFSYDIQLTGAVQQLFTLQTLINCNGGQQNGYYSLPKWGGSGTAVTTTNPWIGSDASNVYTTHPSCTAANVSNLNCVSLKLIIEGPGIPYQVIDCNCSMIVLPVEFIGFSGERTTDGNLLSWSTETENRNDFFTLETSLDGHNWTKLKDIPAIGESLKRQDYSFLDEVNITGSVYYKLSQTDIDGVRNELSMVYIQHGSQFNVFPNPSSGGMINVELNEDTKGDLNFVMVNELGQVAGEWTFEEETYKTVKVVNLENNLPGGVYQLLLMRNNEILERARVIIG